MSVFRLDSVEFCLADIVVCKRVLGLIQEVKSSALAVLDVDGSWHVGAAVEVEEELAALARKHTVCAVLLGDFCFLTVFQVHLVEVTLQRTDLCGGVVGIAFAIEAIERSDDIIAFFDLFRRESLGVMQPNMVISVTLGEPHKLGGAAWQEMRRSLRLNILCVLVVEDGLVEITIQDVVFVEVKSVLATVQDADINLLVVVVPSDGGEVMLLRLAGLHHHVGACRDVVDVKFHDV